MSAKKRHVKAADTSIAVEKSQQDAIAILRRYGATGFGFDHGPDRAVIRFRIEGREVELPVNVKQVYTALHGDAEPVRGRYSLTGDEREAALARWREQAERVAWRNLVDWLDASLSMVTLGVRTLEETFFADLILESTDGMRGRAI